MKCLVCENTQNFKSLNPIFCQADNRLCLKCGLVFIPSRTTLGQKYYKDDGYFKKSPNLSYRKHLISRSLLIEIARYRVKKAFGVLNKDLRKKRAIDIGCGYGEIIYVLKNDYDSKVFGIEASPATAKYGSEIFQVSIAPQLLEEYLPKKKFELIWCSHTLEHVNDPNDFLKRIKILLAKNGLIYIEVPNILKPSGGFDLNTFLYSEHLQTFSVDNLYALLKKHNFEVLEYSDENFLRFWCQVNGGIKKDVPQKVSAKEILRYLNFYQQNYNILSYAKVFSQKLLYVTRLIFYKFYDLILVK